MNLGVRFLLRNNAYLDVVLPAHQAEEIVRNLASGHYELKGEKRLSGRCQSGRTWYVRLDDVVAAHTAQLTESPQNPTVASGRSFR